MLPEPEPDVHGAFDLLDNEMRRAIQAGRQRAARYVEAGDDEKAKELIEKAKFMEGVASKIGPLLEEWNGCSDAQGRAATVHIGTRIKVKTDSFSPDSEAPGECPGLGPKLAIDEYKSPIIRVLGEVGGRARAAAVAEKVFARVKDRLAREDFDGKASRRDEKHWYNRMHWCRLKMKHQGLLRSDSPNGIWELTEKGWEEFGTLRRPSGEAA